MHFIHGQDDLMTMNPWQTQKECPKESRLFNNILSSLWCQPQEHEDCTDLDPKHESALSRTPFTSGHEILVP